MEAYNINLTFQYDIPIISRRIWTQMPDWSRIGFAFKISLQPCRTGTFPYRLKHVGNTFGAIEYVNVI